MNEKEFTRLIKQLVESRDKIEAFYDKVENALGVEAVIFILENGNYLNDAIEILKTAVNDKNDWIKYFFFERDAQPFEVEIDGRNVEIDIDNLYKLITGEEL